MVTAALGAIVQPAAADSISGGASAHSVASVAWTLAAFELGPWEQYLARELTPELPSFRKLPEPHISWIRRDEIPILPDFAHALIDSRRTGESFELGEYRSARFDFGSGSVRGNSGRFGRSMLVSGVSTQVSDSNLLTVSAVLASQHFSHSNADLRRTDELSSTMMGDPAYHPYREVSHGTGVRLALNSEIIPRLALNAAYQSRINMDELANVRGVHGYSADLDIPARVQMGLDFDATQRSSVHFAVSQVFYSDVGAFPSRALPARFNALLGDSTSPQFNWSDLTVYTIGWRWRHESDLEFNLDFHSRSQPEPTAPELAAALEGELAQHSVLMGIGKGLGENTRVKLNASYAPAEFAFGGNVLGVVNDRLGRALEVYASLSLEF